MDGSAAAKYGIVGQVTGALTASTASKSPRQVAPGVPPPGCQPREAARINRAACRAVLVTEPHGMA